MGITKQYLRYSPAGTLNFLASRQSNIEAIQGDIETKGRNRSRPHWVCFSCSEIIYVWDLRRNEKVFEFSSVQENVTCLSFLPKERLLAAGHADGSIAVYNLHTEQLVFSHKGHRSSVTCIAFSLDGSYLSSGSNDTEIVLWDVVAQNALCRLKGHKAPITDCCFMRKHPYLVSSSKDALVKVWDLQTYRCSATLVGHRSEISKFVILEDDRCLVSGSNDAEIRIYDLTFGNDVAGTQENSGENPLAQAMEDPIDTTAPVRWKLAGSVVRHGKERIVTMILDPTERFLCFHANDGWLETIHVRTDERVRELLEKRAKKKRKKLKRESGEEEPEEDVDLFEEPSPSEIVEVQFVKLSPAKCAGKISSVSFLKRPAAENPSVLVNTGNTLITYAVDEASNCLTQSSLVALPAHQYDIRTVAVNLDASTVVTTDSESLRVWNREASQCVHTLPCEYGVSSVMIPGYRHLVVGTKNGTIQLFDVIDGELHETVQAHTGPVRGLCNVLEKKSFISGGDDKEVKFWDMEFGDRGSERKMRLSCKRSLKLDEGVTAVKLSPNQKLLAVALLDNTVKIFFADSLKFFLSLYGHALPVTCLDISSDSQLIVTGSRDKNVKIWGLDFGDCHKSLFAHDDSLTSVAFIPKTHLFFSSGEDGKIKQWDGDKFERITTLSGHHGAVWATALTPDGRTLVSTSHDRTIRFWDKTDEILVLEEEREMEREAEFEKQTNQGEEPVIPGETNKEIGIAGRRSFHALQAAEKIVEALGFVYDEKAKTEAGIQNDPNPILVAYGNMSAPKYVLEMLKRVKPSELQGTLTALSLNDAVALVEVLEGLLTHNSQTELIVKCLTYLLKINALQVESNRLLLRELDHLRSRGQAHVDELKDLVGFNRAALEALQMQIEEREEIKLFADATQQFNEKKKKHKTKAILAMAI